MNIDRLRAWAMSRPYYMSNGFERSADPLATLNYLQQQQNPRQLGPLDYSKPGGEGDPNDPRHALVLQMQQARQGAMTPDNPAWATQQIGTGVSPEWQRIQQMQMAREPKDPRFGPRVPKVPGGG